MLPYPPSTRPEEGERSLLRVLGGVLALVSILLALLGIIFHQRVPDLMLSIIVGIFALRILLLWLGDTPQHKQPTHGRSSIKWASYPRQSLVHTPEQPAANASTYSQTQPLYRPAAMAPPPQILPRSVRPQRPPEVLAFPAPPPQGVQSISPSPVPVPRLSQQENWQYDDGQYLMQQRGNDDGTA